MIKNFQNFINSKKNVLVLGKGYLKKKIIKQYDLYVGVKQSISILPRKDILVMNDFEGIFGLEEYIPDIKFILCPNKIHLNHQPKQEYNLKLYEYLKSLGFKGEIVNYEISSNPNPMKELEFIKCKNSGDIIFHYLNKNHNIDVFGIYQCLDDNLEITKIILNRKNKEFPEEYKSYLNRIYKNKRGINLLMLRDNLEVNLNQIRTNQEFKNLMTSSQEKLKLQYSNLNITFN